MAFMLKKPCYFKKKSIIIILSTQISKPLILCSQNGTIHVSKNFQDQSDIQVELYKTINCCICLNDKLYIGKSLNQLEIFDLKTKVIETNLN